MCTNIIKKRNCYKTKLKFKLNINKKKRDHYKNKIKNKKLKEKTYMNHIREVSVIFINVLLLFIITTFI